MSARKASIKTAVVKKVEETQSHREISEWASGVLTLCAFTSCECGSVKAAVATVW